ncbi:hypothetical protein chiPu_0023792, partial [Chiloscyllium punctatum]|nr:hypothetical protein [Chiloscyllium punctatum]
MPRHSGNTAITKDSKRMLKYAFGTPTDDVYLHTRLDRRLFSLSRLRAKTKAHKVLIRDMMFADDAALATRSEEQLQCQRLMDSFSRACQDFSLKKTNVLGQDIEQAPAITINNYELEVVHEFTYLGSTITISLSLDSEINRQIGRAASIIVRLTKRFWENGKLTTHTKVAVYRACTSTHCFTAVTPGASTPDKID